MIPIAGEFLKSLNRKDVKGKKGKKNCNFNGE